MPQPLLFEKPKPPVVMYLIDGVRVPIRTWKSRQIWGESADAWFSQYSPRERLVRRDSRGR